MGPVIGSCGQPVAITGRPVYKGTVGIITTGIVGAVYAVAYLRNGRNLWALMLAHACTDSYGIAMLYFGRYA
jgi:membrane protease YdiL (CAAX protease family)